MTITKPGRRAATVAVAPQPVRRGIIRRPQPQPPQLVVVQAPAPQQRPDWREIERNRRQGRVRYRLRRQLLPWKVTAGLFLAASAARLAVHLTGDAATVAACAAIAASTVALVTAVVARDNIPATWRRRSLEAAAAGTGWLTWTAATGLSAETIAVLLAGGAALSARWWRRHRIANPTTEPLLAQEVPSSIAMLWADNVGGASGGPCPGSYLAGRREVKRGEAVTEAYDVQLKPGRQSAGSLVANMALVASGLRLASEDLVFDPHPSRDSSRAVMQVIKTSPIKVAVPFPGPQYEYDPATGLGTIALGPFADGADVARYKLYAKNGMFGGVLIGGSGSGKSRMTESIAISAASSGHTTIIYADPQGGASSPALADFADLVARGEDEILELFEGLVRAGQWRTDENSAYELQGFTPTPARSGLLVILDEAHRVLHKGDGPESRTRKLAELIVREYRKAGIGLLLADQSPGIETFGNSDSLRANLMSGGNTFVLRIASKTTKNVLAGLTVDPAELPAIPGYAYQVSPPGEGRTAPFRGWDIGDNDDVKARMAQVRQAPLDDLVANAIGPLYTQRKARAAAAAVARRERIEAMRAGRYTGPAPQEPSLPAAATGAECGQVVQFPTWPADDDTDGLKEAHAKVLDAIRAGHNTPAAIRDATGYGETHVRNVLRELVDAGRIAQAGKGRPYTPATDQATAAS